MANTQSVNVVPVARPLGLKLAVSLAGALVVAGAAQVAIPVAGSAVPFTLQPLAVLIVGGLLGPVFGPVALMIYLAMGAAGLPVWTPIGLPGAARLLGPTGGYLLSYPLAAWAVGRYGGRAVENKASATDVGSKGDWRFTALPPYRLTAFLGTLGACVAGLVIIHLGGWSQLLVITGSNQSALANGLLPFLLADTVKALIAAIVIRKFISQTRALI